MASPASGSSAGWATTSSWRPTRRCWPAPSAARRRGNLDAIERDSPRGRFGYLDAVDYTGTRLPKDARFALVDDLHGRIIRA